MICTFQRELSTFNIIQVKRKKIQTEIYWSKINLGYLEHCFIKQFITGIENIAF